MRKIFLTSGSSMIIFLLLFITGVIDFENTAAKSLIEGNTLFDAGDYGGAVEAYSKGLEKSDDRKLNYNAAQACYLTGNYQQAVDYYGKGTERPDMYLNAGNANLKLGEGMEDANQKLQYYARALEVYKQGILKYPENVPLKFNYEYVLNMIDDLQENEQQQNDEQNNNNQDGGENQENQNGEDGQNENPKQNEQSDDSEKDQNNEPSTEEPENNQGEQSGTEQNQEDSNEQGSSQSEQDREQNETQNGASGNEQNNEQSDGLNAQEFPEAAQTDEEIAQVLEMLERQEAESLKNNQHIRDYGKEDEYDW